MRKKSKVPGAGWRRDVQPFLPGLYAVDARYRRRMADALGVDEALSVQQAMARVAEKRPLCLSPMADRAAAPLGLWTPVRLVLVAGPADQRCALRSDAGVTHGGGRPARTHEGGGRGAKALRWAARCRCPSA